MYFGFEKISAAYGKRKILDELTLEVKKGEFLALCGRNGCGKSTLLKTFSGAVKPCGGRVILEEKPLFGHKRRDIAKKIAYLPQFCQIPGDIDVGTLVSYGRYPHRKIGHGLTAEDREIIRGTLELTELSDAAEREVRSLSGGERQRAWIAMTLCRQPDILILDEPAAHLDLGYQLETMELLSRLVHEKNLTVLCVLHDLNLAARYCDRMAFLSGGRVFAVGSTGEMMTEENIAEVFGISARIASDDVDGRVYCIPQGRIGGTEGGRG
ncbi:MAG: ABC transporter ATP-binding protein [Clostridia bacterium]|nr:ABC transporter ATP-binding protein [Clostridia bacterium]